MKPKIALPIIFLLCFALSLGIMSFGFVKKFPILNYTSQNGKTIDEAYFAKQKTLVIHYHLGCPGAMYAIRDLQLFADSFPYDLQLLQIIENTPNQLEQFNSEEANMWSEIRNYFKLAPITGDLVAECENGTEKTKKIGEDYAIVPSCHILSKKLRIKYSPTFFYVDKSGKITKKIKGFPQSKNNTAFWELVQNAR